MSSFYKNYPNRKDRRASYYDSRRFTTGCKNHGSCEYCNSNRTFANRRREPIVLNSDFDYNGEKKLSRQSFAD